MTALALPFPKLVKGRFASLDAYTDPDLFDACGVCIAFTCRTGGVSTGPYASLNLGSHVDDDLDAVLENRRRVLDAFAAPGTPLLVPNQVHQDTVLCVDALEKAPAVQRQADEGADALVIETSDVAALLCYADCVPVIIVSPTRRFAVIHAGWRGVMNEVSAKSARIMAQKDTVELGNDALSSYNVYLGPHIHKECFETSEEIHDRFVEHFGRSCDAGYRHIDLSRALRVQLERLGMDPHRICDVDLCTVCHNDEFFSYRGQGGVAGRHGAFAVAR